MKKCPICNKEKPLSEYYSYFSKARGKYRHGNYCKPCAKEKSKPRAKKHFEENREERLQYAREYRKNNPDKIKALAAKFSKKYREELKECYVAEHAAKVLKCSTKEIHDNPELLEAYRNNMKLKRIIRNHGKKQTK